MLGGVDALQPTHAMRRCPAVVACPKAGVIDPPLAVEKAPSAPTRATVPDGLNVAMAIASAMIGVPVVVIDSETLSASPRAKVIVFAARTPANAKGEALSGA